MWQKPDEDEVSWTKKDKSSGDPHPDYAYNLQIARNFIAKTESRLPEDMKVAIRGSQYLEEALLVISWMPPRYAKVGNWANPIFLHQPRHDFAKALESVFNQYVRKVEAFERKNPAP